MSNTRTFVILLLAVVLFYIGSIPVPQKCDILENTIDKIVDGADGTKEMLDGKMSYTSYIREVIANELKEFYDQSACYDY